MIPIFSMRSFKNTLMAVCVSIINSIYYTSMQCDSPGQLNTENDA